MVLAELIKISRCYGIIITVLGIALLVMAWPRFKASINHIPVDTALYNPGNRQVLEVARVPGLIETVGASIAIDNTPGYWEDLTTLLFYKAQYKGQFGSKGNGVLAEAKYAAEQSLKQSPGNAFLWYRLSVILAIQKSNPEQIAKTLLMSIMTGPNETSLIWPRLDLCLMFYSAFDVKNLDFLASQVLLAWEVSRKDLLVILTDRKIFLERVMSLLEKKHPQVLKEMVLAVEQAD